MVDGATRALTPARIELIDERGVAQVPGGALRVLGECEGHPQHDWDDDALAPTGVLDPTTDTMHFYASEPIEVPLPPGRYQVTVQKGFEYGRQSTAVELGPGERRELEIELSRWTSSAEAGWFSADGHLHISRPDAQVDSILVQWMRAEDLNVANLLQMGDYRGVAAARQRSFGEGAIHQDGETIIASGQENPRAWILGHGIVLGARSYIDLPDRYLIYRDVWEESRAEGGLNGYAHFRAAGLPVDASAGLIDFLEVLQFDVSDPAALYDQLNLGFRIAPTAGTDFPCFPSGPPGSQRFYTKVEGPLRYASWLDGVRKGRTFVTNGPLLDFSIEGVGIGGDVRLGSAGEVRVRGAVRFDPDRDDVTSLELVREGEVVYTQEEPAAPGVIRFEITPSIDRATWFALRAVGTKVGAKAFAVSGLPRTSAAHTAAILVDVEGSPPLARGRTAARVATTVLDGLSELENRFSVESLEGIQGPLPEAVTGINAEIGLRDRAAVLRGIETAREFYEGIAASTTPLEPRDGSR